MAAQYDDPITRAVAAKVREVLERRDWTMTRLAEQAELSLPTVTRWLNGQRGIPHESMIRALDALGLEFVFNVRPRRKGR
jgi:transcriptional regulator with XRE-family HTH domain